MYLPTSMPGLDLKPTINTLGLLLNIGGWFLYINSPRNSYVLDGGGASVDCAAIERQTERRNSRVRFSVLVVLAGSLLQVISNYLPG